MKLNLTNLALVAGASLLGWGVYSGINRAIAAVVDYEQEHRDDNPDDNADDNKGGA